MGKTLGTILTIAGVAALALTGVGAVAGLAAFGTLAGVGIGTVGLATIATGGLLALSLGEQLSQKAPRPPSSEGTLKNPTPPRVSGYGTRRLYMNMLIWETGNAQTTVDVGAMHDGRVEAYRYHYLNDKRVTLSGTAVNGLDDGTYGDSHLKLYRTHGETVGQTFAAVVGLLPGVYTSNHRGDGISVAALTKWPSGPKKFPERFPQGDNVQYSAAIDMQRCFDWRDPGQDVTDPDTWTWTESPVLHLVHYKLIREGKRPQLPTVILSGGAPIANPAWIAELAAILTTKWSKLFAPTLAYWTAAADDCDSWMPLDGDHTTLAVTAAAGATSITLADASALSVGDDLSITIGINDLGAEPRLVTGKTGNTVSFAAPLGLDHPAGSRVFYSTDPQRPASERRYRGSVLHKHNDPHYQVCASICACFDGWVAPRADGALVIYSGRYAQPDVTIGPSEIVGYSLQLFLPEEDACNELRVSYVSEPHDYATVECDPWADENDAAARGKVLSQPFENQIPSHAQGRRLAKRQIARIMAPARGTVTTNSRGRIALTRRFINLDITEAGSTFYAGPAEITKVSRNLATGGITFDWVAADPNIDAWNPITEEGLPAPVGNRTATEPLETPTISGATVNFGSNSGGGTVGAFIDLDVTGPADVEVRWFARTRTVGSAVWGEREYNDLDPSLSVALSTEFVPTEAMVEVEVAYQTPDGRVSDWSPTETVDTSTADVAPPTPTDFSAAGGAGQATLAWRNPVSRLDHLDVYRSAGTTFGAATRIYAGLPGGLGQAMEFIDTVGAGTWRYWIVAVSAGGAPSSPAGPATATVT